MSGAPDILFVLPVGGGGGGPHSVVQEAVGLTRLGVRAEIAVDARNYTSFVTNYPELGQHRIRVASYAEPSELADCMATFDIAVATTNGSVGQIAEARNRLKAAGRGAPKVAYYIQDYEPLFYEPNSAEWNEALASYSLVPDAILFAKTDWIRRIVYANHGARVHKVRPSIDHDIYFPNLGRETADLSVAAMVRPQTPRRAPRRTVRILEMLASEVQGDIALQIFGADDAALRANGLKLSPRIVNHGVLTRQQAPGVLRAADLFLDLSDYQAFGRTGLESMACACVPVVPLLGGSAEYAVHLQNAYVVDTRSDEAILEAVRHFIGLSGEDRWAMRQNALETAAEFTITRAAVSELKVFTGMLA